MSTTTQITGDAFFSRMNPTTGAIEWMMQDQEYDYHQEVARSAYADMLHDHERNKKYYVAIQEAVKIIHERGEKAHVLDIGTGTGLLSMMAAQAGADMVTACEAFVPMAHTAVKIVKLNGFQDKIKVVSKRSTEMIVGPDGDMPFKANILATEVFDTELIGEGALPTYKHALEHLLEDDCITVPSSATVIAQVVESEMIWKWHKLLPIKLPNGDDIIPPADMESCPGAPSVHDFHLDELRCDQFQPITRPVELLHFPFNKYNIQMHRSNTVEVKVLQTGRCHAVFMWWDLQMDTKGEVLLSTTPYWAMPSKDEWPQWRDHWIQAAYYLPKAVYFQKDETLRLSGSHDDYCIWFDVKQVDDSTVTDERPICESLASMVWSRQRIGMLNDETRQQKYTKVLRQLINADSLVLSVSDNSLLALMAAKLGAKKVFTVENRSGSHGVIDVMVRENSLQDKVKILNKRVEDLIEEDLEDQKVSIVIGEPYFMNSVVPWHNIYFWYARTKLDPYLTPDCQITPRLGLLRAIVVEFEHLWKIRAPIGELEGFDVSPFDELIQKSMEYSDRGAEPHPLWEYPCRPLTQDIDLLNFDFSKILTEKMLRTSGSVAFQSSGTCHGVVLWMDYKVDDNTTIQTGLLDSPSNYQDKLNWDPHSQQGVYFLPENAKINIDTQQPRLDYNVTFEPNTGDVQLYFKVV
ncbi:protein arginine N-methyltransferase 7-like [Saccoglossus kowalevskii]|uniref:Protein arginine N-methyltransferase n=1 Tax=Saccoglossus kowalevskii TaxID=10224 RepID=A0ABM0GQH9_SACKO|nr:PREDICTED: protein arginine N-methyltransferase 7-like [Saccoglossus kowalevskii]